MTDQAETLREIMRTKSGFGKSKTRIIAVSSGKGGVGKTNLSVNLAMTFAQMGKKVVVLDADLGLANVNVVLDVVAKYNLYHLIKKQKTLKDILVDTNYGIQIVAGASGFSKIANLSEEELNFFVEEMSGLSDADIIIVDTGAGVSNNVLSFISAADDVIIVTTPEPTAITDAYGIVKIIATEVKNSDLSLKLVVNRVNSVTEGKKVAQRIIGISGQFLNIKVDYLGYVYNDPVVSKAVLKRKPFMVVDPNCKASVCVRQLVSRLENIEYKEGKGFQKFLTRLMKRN